MDPTEKNNILYTAHEIDYAFRDQDTKPCFGVQRIASCFLSQIDNIAQSQANNLCMFGIFGQWGRGKTYLWHQMREIIAKRNCDKNDQHIYYDIVEFNAWKYQDTPALWAYLYETIYNKGNCWIRFCNRVYQIKTQTSLCLYITLFLCLCAVVAFVVLLFCDLSSIEKAIAGAAGIVSIIAIIRDIFAIIEQIHIFYTNIQTHCGYGTTLGVQNELEKDLEKLLCTWVCKRRINRHRILLYVDDIDRCEEDKMISILDSLRTILENPEIQKRLVVVCSIDKDRISAAIQRKYSSYKCDQLTNEYIQRNMITEQLDKLFIFSVGLPKLDTTQQQRFVDCLYQDMPLEQDTLPYSTARRDGSLSAFHGQPQEKFIDENTLTDWLKRFVDNEKNSSITPRKLRIIYYRMLFANNLLADKNEVYFTEQFAKNIFDHSIHRKIDDTMIDKCLSDVLEMVVPY